MTPAVRGRAVAVAVAAGCVLSAAVGAAFGITAAHRAADRFALPAHGVLTEPTATLHVASAGVRRLEGGACGFPALATHTLPSVVTITSLSPSEEGTGAGVVLTSNGYILTNNHVVASVHGGRLTVTLSDGRSEIPARIVGVSPLDDLAVVKVALTGLQTAVLGNSSALRVGDPVIAVGSPLGYDGTVTAGIVSALHRNVPVPSATTGVSGVILTDAIQTDAAINPGNSGGALIDCAGQVVGINSAIASTGASTASGETGSIGVGFAIPIDYARTVASELIRTGHAVHSFLGVLPEDLNPYVAEQRGLPPGAYLARIVPGSPAARAGLRAGDVVIRLGTLPVTDAEDLYGATRSYRPGDRVRVVFVRDGVRHSAMVTLAVTSEG